MTTNAASAPTVEEHQIPLVPLGDTWVRQVGADGDRTPVVLLHGGPGFNSEYLRPFEALAHTGRPVIRYDQIGGGRSVVADRHHASPDSFSIEVFRTELAALRDALGLSEAHLIGQSWGCMLALEHVLDGAPGIRGLVLESGLASMAEWNAETARLRSELPADVIAVLDAELAAGRGDGPAFKEAYAVWERRHVLRMDEPPPWERDAIALFEAEHRVYDRLAGGAEFPTDDQHSVLAGWDVRPRLHEIGVPTLLLSGRHDEATPAVVQTLHQGIVGSEWHVLEDSSHSCHSEQEALTMTIVADFLARADATASGAGR